MINTEPTHSDFVTVRRQNGDVLRARWISNPSSYFRPFTREWVDENGKFASVTFNQVTHWREGEGPWIPARRRFLNDWNKWDDGELVERDGDTPEARATWRVRVIEELFR